LLPIGARSSYAIVNLGRFLDLARGDLRDHDGSADHVAGALLAARSFGRL
jgi:hypothetical protein